MYQIVLGLCSLVVFSNMLSAPAQDIVPEILERTIIVDSAPDWRTMTSDDFLNVNCDDGTWNWTEHLLTCSGLPVGVYQSKEEYEDFELVLEWRHMRPAGNSGIFLWVPSESLDTLERGQLPHGIEVQILDPAYRSRYEHETRKKANWFTCHGDIFPVGAARMKPFPPVAPNGARSFPSEHLTYSSNHWNHYYIRAFDGVVRLWVNGKEVSGGQDCEPRRGFICLESEGSPIEFRKIRIRELP